MAVTDPPASQLPEREFIEKLRFLNGAPVQVLSLDLLKHIGPWHQGIDA